MNIPKGIMYSWMPLVMQELLTIRKHLSATPIFSEFVLFNL